MSRDLEATYQRRFAGMEEKRLAVWEVLCRQFFQRFVEPEHAVLDIGAGYCEFINSIHCARKVAIDLNPVTPQKAAGAVEVCNHDVGLPWPLESGTIDVAFSSNFLEHLPDRKVLLHCLKEAARVLRDRGRIILLGPNIRYCYDVYWDFFDHHLPLSDRSITEALSLAGFEVETCVPRFLPYTMQGRLPPSRLLVSMYLRLPPAWNMLGKQFLVVARKR